MIKPTPSTENKETCLVWWNGKSALKLHDIVPKGYREFGCNYILNSRDVTDICVYDGEQVAIINDKNHWQPGHNWWCQSKYQQYITQLPPKRWRFKPLKDQGIKDTGCMALEIARQEGYKNIHVIGCDWGVSDASIYDVMYANNRWHMKVNQHYPGKVTQPKIEYLLRLQTAVNINWVTETPQKFMQNHSTVLDWLNDLFPL